MAPARRKGSPGAIVLTELMLAKLSEGYMYKEVLQVMLWSEWA